MCYYVNIIRKACQYKNLKIKTTEECNVKISHHPSHKATARQADCTDWHG